MNGLTWRRTLLGLVITAPFLALIFLRTDLRETGEALAGANYGLVAVAMVLFVLAVWLQAFRWKLLLRHLADVPLLRLYPVIFVGHMGNSLLPLRGGELLRVLVIAQRERLSRVSALGTVAVERVLDGLMLVLLLFVFVAFYEGSGRLWELAAVAGVIFGLATIALAAAAVWEERSQRLSEVVIDRLPGRWRPILRRWVASFLLGARAVHTPAAFAGVVFYTVAFWGAIAVIYLLVGAAFGIHEGIGAFLLVTGAATMGLSLPASQGGLGPFEFFARESLILVGVAAPVATAYAIALHLVLLIPTIAVGLFFLWTMDISLRDLLSGQREEREAESEAALEEVAARAR